MAHCRLARPVLLRLLLGALLLDACRATCEGTGYEVGEDAPCCWHNGDRVCCPEGFSMGWDEEFPQLTRSLVQSHVEYQVEAPFGEVDSLCNEDDGCAEIPHTNLHACSSNVGFCTPMISNDGTLSTHSPTQTGNFTGTPVGVDLSLEEGVYTIIAHARFYVDGERIDAAIASFGRFVQPALACPSDCNGSGSCEEQDPPHQRNGQCLCDEGRGGDACEVEVEKLDATNVVAAFVGATLIFIALYGSWSFHKKRGETRREAGEEELDNISSATALIAFAKVSATFASTALNLVVAVQIFIDDQEGAWARASALGLIILEAASFITSMYLKRRLVITLDRGLTETLRKSMTKGNNRRLMSNLGVGLPNTLGRKESMAKRVAGVAPAVFAHHGGPVTGFAGADELEAEASAILMAEATILTLSIEDLVYDSLAACVRGILMAAFYSYEIFHVGNTSNLILASFVLLACYLGTRLSAFLVVAEKRAVLRLIYELLACEDVADGIIAGRLSAGLPQSPTRLSKLTSGGRMGSVATAMLGKQDRGAVTDFTRGLLEKVARGGSVRAPLGSAWNKCAATDVANSISSASGPVHKGQKTAP
eukprot:CAMPEP_0118872924 /NCGR_PEP_ID=MMETSP1163-20130328/14933_1 /TAXON_ID=124430 /ORGANISM="Phaeomonas parva, Strain CCMP2877" /LENGTH=593 /DNA_ID=CAMNT_0006808163 /DNA_START=108 /DNA_END=1889 /DNA_ORIENTATION=+